PLGAHAATHSLRRHDRAASRLPCGEADQAFPVCWPAGAPTGIPETACDTASSRDVPPPGAETVRAIADRTTPARYCPARPAAHHTEARKQAPALRCAMKRDVRPEANRGSPPRQNNPAVPAGQRTAAALPVPGPATPV